MSDKSIQGFVAAHDNRDIRRRCLHDQLRGGRRPWPTAEKTTDADGSDLARCRSVTSEETAGYQLCQKVWAENRRRFFGRKDGAAVPSQGNSAAGRPPSPKDQSRMPQGYPSVAIPEASKP
jgi:conjugative transfer region protein TrbK